MLLPSLVAAFAGLGFVLEAIANPLHLDTREPESGSVRRRDIPHSLHERHLPQWQQKWTKRSKLPDDRVLPMRIGLKQSNIEAAQQKLVDISTPGSENYGKHMTSDEVIDFFAPKQSTTDAVTQWLVESGLSPERFSISANKLWVQFDVTVTEAEELFIAEFFVWEHVSSGSQDISTEAYHLPSHIQEHVDYVTPGTRMRTKKRRNTSGAGDLTKRAISGARPLPLLSGFPNPNSSTCDLYVTKECTQTQYSIPNTTTAFPGNELGIYESSDVHYSRHDLDVYFSTLYPWIPNGTYPKENLIDGAIGAIEDDTTNKWNITLVPNDLEAPLDFDTAMPLIYPQGVVLWQEDDEPYERLEATTTVRGGFNDFLDSMDGSYCTYSAFGETGNCVDPKCADPVYPDPDPAGYQGTTMCGVFKPTNVISISYGMDESFYPDFYIQRQCNEFMKLVLQGTTVVMSSGDSGVEGIFGSPCLGESGLIFDPDTSASCPYILAVGATEWDRFDAAVPPVPGEKLNEVAVKNFASGGGFSNVFGVADYQRKAVAGYFEQVESSLPFRGYHHAVVNGNFSSVVGDAVYHHGGRGYPDVAAVGRRQVTYQNGQWWLVGGTSLSSPVWGSVLTLVNEARLVAGKSTVGFINPILYAHPEVFNDVTVGSNPGCNTTGFPAAPGWDPVTGLGSPNYPLLLELLMSL